MHILWSRKGRIKPVRIIAGSARGCRLEAPAGDNTRPTHARVREAVFSMLMPYLDDEGAVLDLFAGSGAMALEACSRGMARAVLVDASPLACACIRKNIVRTGMAERCTLLQMDARRALARLRGTRFSLIVLDPPYDTDLLQEALAQIREGGLLAPEGVALCEYRYTDGFAVPEGYCQKRAKKYGIAGVSLLGLAKEGGENA